MIMVIGEYFKVINKEGSLLAGMGYKVSKEISINKSSLLFVTKISNDGSGLQLLDFLVENEIMFDPFLCNQKLVTPNINSRSVVLPDVDCGYENSILTPLSKRELVEVFQNQDDINVIYYGLISAIKYGKPLDFIDAVNTIELKPIKYFNLVNDSEILIPFDKENVDVLIKFANIVQVNCEYIEQYDKSLSIEQSLNKFKKDFNDVSILYFDEYNIRYYNAFNSNNSFKIVKKYNSNKKNINEIIAATFLSYLHDNDFFGSDIENPIFKESYVAISDALEAVKKALERD